MENYSFLEAVHLVKMEPCKAEALEFIAILRERGNITKEIEEELQDYVAKIWG